MIIISRMCTLIFNSYDFHVCGSSSVSVLARVNFLFRCSRYAYRCIAGDLISVMEKKERYCTNIELLLVGG